MEPENIPQNVSRETFTPKVGTMPPVSTTTATSLIQEQVAQILVEPLQAGSVILSTLPATSIFDSSEPLRIPTITAGVEPEVVGENELIPSDDSPTFGEIKLMPSDRKSIKTIVRVSNELIRAATQNVSAVLERRIVSDVANKLDDELLNGDGVDGAITGLFNQAGLTTAPVSMTDYDGFLDALAAMSANEVTPNQFYLSGADFFALRKLKDTTGNYIMQAGAGVSGGVEYQLFDIPVKISNKIPAGKGALANTFDIAAVRDIDPTVTILNERYAEYDQVGIRVTTRYDLGLLRPQSVLLLDTSA